MKKRILSIIAAVAMIVTMMPAMAFAAGDEPINVSSAKELCDAIAETAKNPASLTVNITADIDLSGTKWTPGNNGAGTYTINGNGHKITGLTGPLFDSTWAGSAQLIINNLTIANSKISGGANNHGLGAFVGHSDSIPKVVLNDCHLTGSSVTGADWTGGLIGWAAGYNNQNDGAVFSDIEIKNCSVTNCTITGGGSTGALMGHATANAWTKVTITGSTVKGNTITCTDSSNIKAGSVMGTVGAGTVDQGKEGGVDVDATVSGNTVTSNGVANNRIYGRFGNPGKLTITGGVYCDWTDPTVKPDDGTLNIAETAVFGHNYVNGVCTACGKSMVTVTLPPTIDPNKQVTEVEVGTDAAAEEVLKATATDIIDSIKAGNKVDGVDEKVVTAIQNAVAKNQEIEIEKEVVVKVLSEAEANKDDAALIVKTADGEIAQYLDLSVLMTVTVNGQEVASSEITELSAPMTFTIAIPDELKTVEEGKTREYFIIRVHEGVATEIPVTVNADGTLSFETDCFSTYALGYKDTVVKNTENPSGNNNGNASTNNSGSTSGKGNSSNNAGTVRTGDSTNVAGLMAVLVLSFGVCVLALRRRVVK